MRGFLVRFRHMCGRFDLHEDPMTLARRYKADAEQVALWVPHYNVAPTANVPVLFGDGGEREFQFARWGLQPEWYVKKFGPHKQQINARAETLRDKPYYRKQMEERRCILPVTGYYEWQKSPSGKLPYRFAPSDGGTFSLACIWEVDAVHGTDQVTFAIVTTTANALMRPVHDRMPVSLDDAGVTAWLDTGTPTAELVELMAAPMEGGMRAYRVSRDVNNPANDRPDLIEPAA